VEAAAAWPARPAAATATAVMMTMSAPVRVTRYSMTRVTPMQ